MEYDPEKELFDHVVRECEKETMKRNEPVNSSVKIPIYILNTASYHTSSRFAFAP